MGMRAVVERFGKRDWPGVVIEILIVVIGVFIGLQASSWNQGRVDAAKGNDYLQRIHADLLKESRILASRTAFWQSVGEYGRAAVGYAEGGPLHRESAWKTLLAYYQASQIWPYRQPGTTYEEIRSTGNLLLIRDPMLRSRLSEHYDQASGNGAVEILALIPAYRERVRGMTPSRIQQYIWSDCYRSTDNLDQTLLDCAAPVSEAEALAVIEPFRNDAVLTRQLRFWLSSVAAGQMIMHGIQVQADAIASELAVQGQTTR